VSEAEPEKTRTDGETRRGNRLLAHGVEYWTPASALVIAAHPDDIEFGCAGTVARWVLEGSTVSYGLLTNGAAGSKDPGMTRERLAEIRANEQRASAKVVGVDDVHFLGHEDGLLEPTLEVRKQIVRLIRQVRPEVVVTTDPMTRYVGDFYINHPDHRAAGEAVLAAVIPGSDTHLAYPELIGEGLDPVKLSGVWLMLGEGRNVVVDVSDTLDRKLDSLRCHVSQVGDPMSEEDASWVRRRAEDTAADEPFEYGEGFRVFKLSRPTVSDDSSS
jgi:LmbE family N-acetylglucosaminyl deacetylase